MNDQGRLVFQTPDSAGEARGGATGQAADRSAELPVFGERQLREFESSPRAMRIFDRASLRYLAVNDAALRLYGYSREELLELTVKDTRHPDEHHIMLANIAEPAGLLMNFGPHRHIRKSGEIIMVEVIAQDVLFNARPARVTLTMDVTERIRVMELLRQREQEFETLAEHLPDLIARFDRHGRYVYVNSAVEKLTGAGRNAILGRTQRELGMPDTVVERFERSLAETVHSGQAHTLEFSYPGASGSSRLFEAYHVPERDATGSIATVLCVARDITERKRTERELRKNEEFLRRVIESSRDCIKVLELDGSIAWMSSGGQRLMELEDVSALVGRPYPDFFSGTDREAALAALAAARAGGACRFEGYCPSAKGTPRWWDEIATPILGADGTPERLLVVSRDVTDSKKAEIALRDSEARFELAVENTGLGMWDWNVRTGEMWLHPRWAKILGYELEEVPAHIRMWQDFCHPDDRPQTQARLLDHFAGKTSVYRAHYRMRHKRGSWIWIGSRGIVIERDPDGSPLRMLGYIRDITERKVMEQALRESQEQFRAVTETANDAIVSADCTGNIVYFNQAAARIFGYSVAEAIGEPLTLLMPDRFRDAHRQGLQRVTSGDPSSLIGKTAELVGRRKDGTEFPVELSLASWRTDSGAFFTGIVRDITNRKRREALQSTLAAIVNNSADAIISENLNGVICTWNPGAEGLFGYQADEAIGQSVMILMPEDRRDEESLILERIRRGEPTEHFESVRRKKDGALVDVSLTISPVKDVAGTVVGASTIVRDITERKRAESAVRESNEFLRGMLESSRDCIKVLDLEGSLVWMSTWGQRLMEIDDLASVLGRSYLDFWSGTHRESTRAALATARAGGVGRFEGHCPSAKGTPMWWDGIAAPILSDDGKPEKLLVASRDVTESQRAKHALRESEERFRQLAENIREVFWINTPAGDSVIYVSPAYEEIWGRSCESLYRNPRDWMESIHPDDLPAVQADQEKMPRREHTDIEYRIVRPDGTLRWIRDRSYPTKRGDGTPLVCGIAEDITEQKRAEEQRLTHAIHQRDALVREVHHRIKNHLQGIAGLLRNKAEDDPAATETIEAAVAQLQSVAVVYGLQSELAESGVPLCRVLEAICSSAEGLSGARVVRAFAANAGAVRLASNEAVPIAVALNELVFNAIEHGVKRGGPPRIEVALSEKKDGADIRIVNRGRLSARFDYSKGIGTGTGLDLVKTLLGPSGGELRFDARNGKVQARLSLRPPLVAVQRQPAPTPASHSGK